MGQYWKLVNLDDMTVVETRDDLGVLRKLGEKLWNNHSSLIQLLAVPPFPPKPHRVASEPKLVAIQRLRRSTPPSFADLLACPEIVSTIFSFLDEYADALRFGLTNSSVWDCGERRIRQGFVEYQAPWAGKRLIHFGDYAKDVPTHLNNAVDLSRFATNLNMFSERDCNVWFDGMDPDGTPTNPKPKNLQFDQVISEEAKQRWNSRLGKLIQMIQNYSSEAEFLPHTDCDLLEDVHGINGAKKWVHREYITREHRRWTESRQSMDNTNSEDEVEEALDKKEHSIPRNTPVMLLRNLSKKVLIRSDALEVNGYDPVWGFGKAIMCRISWSTDPSTSMRWEGTPPIHRGQWAGDAFDVVFLESPKMFSDLLIAGWRDGTSELREEMVLIWKSQFDQDWWQNSW
ncbi:hypothetical protein DL93DRAFT_2164955 [Clavulina sp. PMI_390]|nr:hypothetical protein DL93DRAFT_2164955 [Clavulina sp. PMI_390]